jgi:hypothetical protein
MPVASQFGNYQNNSKYINQNNINLTNELNQYKNENNQLKQQINILQQNNNQLKQQINILRQNNNQLSNQLQIANQTISILNNNQKQSNIKVNNDDIIMKYKKEINDLKIKLAKYEKSVYVNFNDIMVVNFQSGDGQVRHGIQCLKTETFAEVEEKLYKMFDEYRNTNNIFLVKGNIVLRFKTISENKIQNGDVIQLQVPAE